MKRLVIGCYAVALVCLAAAPAASQTAPPQYQSSDPEKGATVHQPPQRVEVTFDQPLDDSSSLAVTDECDRQLDSGTTEVSGNTMSIEIVKTPSGMYHVEYLARGVAGVTGENNDMFMFTVHGGKACDGGSGHDDHGKDPNEHDGRHDDDDDHGNDHAGTGHDRDDHSSSTDHTESHGTAGTDHSGMGSHDGDEHSGTGGQHDEHEARADDPITDQALGITSSDTARKLFTRADSRALMISLGLCALLGILGGAVLRASGAR